MVEMILKSWAIDAQAKIDAFLERAGRSNDEFERAYLEARIREQRERKAALRILQRGIR